MKRIAIIINSVLDTRLFLRTAIFDLLKNNPANRIFLYTDVPKRIKEEFKSPNVKVRGLKFLFGIKKADIILLSNWEIIRLNRILKIATENKIPTLFVEEGISNSSCGYSTDIYPTALAVWSDVEKRLYGERGIDTSRIIVTGPARFDLYHGLAKNEALPKNGKKVLLFMTQWFADARRYPDSNEVVSKHYQVIYEAKDMFGLQLVCKLHPSDREEFYKRDGVIILKDTGVRPQNYAKWYCNTGYDPSVQDMKGLGGLLLSSDIVTTFFSTVSLEAMIFNKPVILFDMAGFYKKSVANETFVNKCKFALAADKKEFFNLLEKYLKYPAADSEKRKEVVFDFAYKQDGQACRRVVDAVEGLLE